MTKTKSTKSALLLSALSLLMCVSMLVGSTFAWFTDSVTSAGNIIQSGTLKVTMEWAEGTEAVPADDSADWKDASADAIFDYDKWEPGYVSVRHIKIANEGTLALKYQLNIVANGEVSELTDVIDVYYVDPAVQVADRAALTEANKLGTLTKVLADISTTASGELLAGNKDTVTLALKMQETAGNKYQGMSIGSDFSVQLLATQLASEFDSFDDQYDEKADYIVKFTSGTHDLNTTLLATKPGDTVSATGANTVVNINGGYYDAGSIYNNCAVWAHAGGTINIFDGTFIADGDTAEQNSGHHYDLIYAGSGKDTETSYINIYGGMFSVRNNGWLLNEADGKGEITVYGGTFVNWNPADNESEGAHTNFLADGRYVTIVKKANGDIWYTVAEQNANEVLATPETVQDVVNSLTSEQIALLLPGKYDTITAKSNVTIKGVPGAVVDCVNLNGATNVTLLNIDFDAAGAQAAYDKSNTLRIYANIISGNASTNVGARNLVIDGCTFTGKFADGGAAISFTDKSRPSGGSGNVTVKNCTFNTENAYYDVYGYYTGSPNMTFTIEGNTFASECKYLPIYLGRLKTSAAIVVKGNTFKTEDTLDNSVNIQGDNHTPTLDASGNTFGA